MNAPIVSQAKLLLAKKLSELEDHFDADILTYYGPIVDGNETIILSIIENLADDDQKRDNLVVVLTTGGGSAIAVERYVNIIRHHYNEVHFIVPDYAYSAGTIFCMSGDSIYMDYFSVLGPIDPQIQNKDGKLVAALGYLDKVNEMIQKSQNGTLSEPEFFILKDLDLAELRSYEQAKELTIALLKKWLVKYKFKNWDIHQTNPTLKGQSVTPEEKEKRAEEIADSLSDNNMWKSHGRPINLVTLKEDLKLKIEDYSNNVEQRSLIRSYYDLVKDYAFSHKIHIFVHTRKYL
jgi:membrane-bound ClpP family serine protease